VASNAAALTKRVTLICESDKSPDYSQQPSGAVLEIDAAGLAPLVIGEPAYRAALDWDGDGLACES
jgi:hypothetical protein